MGMPNKRELDRVRRKLSKVEPTHILPKDASAVDRLKYDLCKEVITYIREHNVEQAKLAEELKIDPARISEIVKYKIDLFTIDRLLNILEQIRPSVHVKVA